MNKYTLKINGVENKDFYVPTSKSDITLEQWNNAYKWMQLAEEARQSFEDGDTEIAQVKIIESICHTIAELSKGIDYVDLMGVSWDKINNLFLIAFVPFLQNEKPKREFKIKGKRFIIPNFVESSAGDFLDCMSLIAQVKDDKDHERGLLIAAIYMRHGEYYQDLQSINERIEFLKEHGRMDLFYSCAFFLLNSLKNYKQDIQQPLIVAELESLTSSLNSWGTTLYLQTLQNRAFFRTP